VEDYPRILAEFEEPTFHFNRRTSCTGGSCSFALSSRQGPWKPLHRPWPSGPMAARASSRRGNDSF